jgi:predicted membrane protein
MTPDLIFGIAIAIIAVFVLCALLFISLNNVAGESTNAVIGLFILLCGLILLSATFFAKHVDLEYQRDLMKVNVEQLNEPNEEELQNELLEVLP